MRIYWEGNRRIFYERGLNSFMKFIGGIRSLSAETKIDISHLSNTTSPIIFTAMSTSVWFSSKVLWTLPQTLQVTFFLEKFSQM